MAPPSARPVEPTPLTPSQKFYSSAKEERLQTLDPARLVDDPSWQDASVRGENIHLYKMLQTIGQFMGEPSPKNEAEMEKWIQKWAQSPKASDPLNRKAYKNLRQQLENFEFSENQNWSLVVLRYLDAEAPA